MSENDEVVDSGDGDLFDFNDELESLFKNAEVKDRSGKSVVPDGKYSVKVTKAALEKSQKGSPRLNLHLQIDNGNHKNRLLFKSYNLDQKVGLSILKEDISKFGVKLDSLKELKDKVGDFLDLRVSVVKKTKEGSTYPNIYINDLLPSEEESDSETASSSDDDF